ncbi:MAG: hypothetical protein HN380_24755 [Victivallales bacterium]|nr:hypothetical protein [Victivallales bacterium]
MKPNFISLLVVMLAFWWSGAPAQTARLSGQASVWGTATNQDSQFGLQYIPELSLATPVWEDYEIGMEAALAASWFGRYDGGEVADSEADAELYRLWVRFASPQLELRAGLQKISFGPATLLRPLKWFDTLDPRDPLGLTDGVYGLLGRYYFLNNANIWLWGLYGNDELRGWETIPTDEHDIEFGGRVQWPVGSGEAGLSYHRRRADPGGSWLHALHPEQGSYTEQRIGIDGKWDVGVGLWFEGMVTRQDLDVLEPRYERLFTVGMDYTFDIGNGPHVLCEQLVSSQSVRAFGSGNSQFASALSVDCPLSVLDRVSAITYYDWEREDWLQFVAWRRTYDRWQIHVSAFWGPDRARDGDGMMGSSAYGGKGVQFMLVFNH